MHTPYIVSGILWSGRGPHILRLNAITKQKNVWTHDILPGEEPYRKWVLSDFQMAAILGFRVKSSSDFQVAAILGFRVKSSIYICSNIWLAE